MATITLQRNVQFLYEEHLARAEALALGCDLWDRDESSLRQVRVDVNGQSSTVLRRAAYVGSLDGEDTVYGQLIRPKFQGGAFNRTRSVNQYLTHWIYPYRGKFHPQMVRALLNIIGARRGSVVLDPHVGSGTTALEASLLEIQCIGVDISPLCVLLTRVKTRSVEAVAPIRERVAALLERETLDPADASVAVDDNPLVADFVQVARMTTLSDVSRRKRDGDSWFRRNLSTMLQSVEAHARALEMFDIRPGQVSAVQGDARDLRASGIEDSTIDAVVTSPPYSIALDYVKNDEHALEALGIDPTALRTGMTGVRGQGPKEKIALYNEDIQAVFCEVARVLKPGAKAAFVIGDATVDGRELTTTKDMKMWAASAGLELEGEVQKVIFGLYSTMKDEMILLFKKRHR